MPTFGGKRGVRGLYQQKNPEEKKEPPETRPQKPINKKPKGQEERKKEN